MELFSIRIQRTFQLVSTDLFANIYRTVVIVSIDLMPLWLDYVLY